MEIHSYSGKILHLVGTSLYPIKLLLGLKYTGNADYIAWDEKAITGVIGTSVKGHRACPNSLCPQVYQ